MEGKEYTVVETVVAQQLLLHEAQELSRTRSLDDAVIVGGGQGDHLGDAQAGDGARGRTGEFGGVHHRAHPDNQSLADHQARHRLRGTKAARVGQRDRGPLVILHRQFVLAAAAHQILVGREEIAERHQLGGLDGRDYERAAAIGALHVDGHAEVHVFGQVDRWLSVLDPVGLVHVRHLHERFDRRIRNEVGERDLTAASRGQVVVDESPVVEHDLRGDLAEGGCGGDFERGIHVGRDRLCHALEGDDVVGTERRIRRGQFVMARVMGQRGLSG